MSWPCRLSFPSTRNQLAEMILLNEVTELPLITEGTEGAEDEKKGQFGVISKENKEKGCKLKLSKSTSTPKKIMVKNHHKIPGQPPTE